MAALTDPRSLRTTLGREGWCQRVLTELILEDRYPPYNTRRVPSARGARFFAALDELSFGDESISGRHVVFVDEIDFPARHPDEQGCAPDYTVFVDDRCWIIELKTEPGSHRPRQVPDYFERARHYHPDLRVDLTYLTAGLRAPFEPATEPWARYVHLEWGQVVELIWTTWGEASEDDLRNVAELLVVGIEHLAEPTTDWWRRLGYEPSVTRPSSKVERGAGTRSAGRVRHLDASVEEGLDAALEVATATGTDGEQRAIGLETGGLEELQALRLVVHRACQGAPEDSPLRHVQPWLWNAATSGGRALTDAGATTGYELRLSRYRLQAALQRTD